MTMYADMGSGGEPQPHASRYAVDTATQVAIGSVADAVAIPVQEPPAYRVSVICICAADAAERKATIERAIVWERKRAQGFAEGASGSFGSRRNGLVTRAVNGAV